MRIKGGAPARTAGAPLKTLSVHANVRNHFNSGCHVVECTTYKLRHSAALAEWQSLLA